MTENALTDLLTQLVGSPQSRNALTQVLPPGSHYSIPGDPTVRVKP